MSDTVKRIERNAFTACIRLEFVKLSTSLEYIGHLAFFGCSSLSSIFIPPSCREIGKNVFRYCKQLLILHVSQDIQLGRGVFRETALIEASPFEMNEYGYYVSNDNDNQFDETAAIQWIKSINDEETYALHRACTSYNPLSEIIHTLVNQQGLKAMRMKNAIDITPSQYLEANTFTDISEKEIVNKYILDMMGETV